MTRQRHDGRHYLCAAAEAPRSSTPRILADHYELSLRRDLSGSAEDMVNVAFDARSISPRATRSSSRAPALRACGIGRYDGGFQRFSQALTVGVTCGGAAYRRDGKLSARHRRRDLDTGGRLAAFEPYYVAGVPAWARRASPKHRLKVARAWRGVVQADGHQDRQRRRRGSSREMSAEQLATVSSRRAPAFRPRPSGVAAARGRLDKIRDYSIELLSCGSCR